MVICAAAITAACAPTAVRAQVGPSGPSLGSSLAQQVNPNAQTRVREQTQEQQRAQDAAAAAAAIRQRESAPPRAVTFDDVLKDPDNVEINFDYARTQVAQGDLKGAVATLERMLLNNPELAQVRLFYAIVLYRLDSLDESERELRNVLQYDMPDSLRQEIQAYLDRIAFRRQATHYSATLAFGAVYDSNRNSAPRSGSVLFQDMPIDLPDNQHEHSDKGFLSIGTFRFNHDLGYQDKHELFGGILLLRDDQLHLNEQNLQSYVLDMGATYHSPWVDMTINPTYTKLRLGDQSYYDAYGGRFRLDHKIDESLAVYAEYTGQFERFKAITPSPSSIDRTGARHDLRSGIYWNATPTLQFNTEFDYTRKDAHRDYVAYNGYALVGNMTYLLDGGQFLLLNAQGERDNYVNPDFFVSAARRSDTILRVRGTYGAPLGFFAGLIDSPDALPSYFADITFTGALEWLDNASNIPNDDFSNLKAQFLLTKRWDF